MTKTELDDLEKLAKEATPGPWEFVDLTNRSKFSDQWASYEVRGPERFDDNGNDGNFSHRSEKRGDASFIAALNPSTALRLISLAKFALEARDALEEIARPVPLDDSILTRPLNSKWVWTMGFIK